MISVMDHANNASGKPGEIWAVGVAITTPQTTITLERTWNVVITGLLGTRPVAACIIFKINFKIIWS